MDEVTRAGLDIDQSMVLKVGDTLHYGADAIREVTALYQRRGLADRLNLLFFSNGPGRAEPHHRQGFPERVAACARHSLHSQSGERVVTSVVPIPAGEARAVDLAVGSIARVVNTEGHQVVDTWAFCRADLHQHLSMEHSRSATYRILFQPGDVLVSTRFRPMFTILADTSPGIHDTLHAACSPESNVFYGMEAAHPNCQNNLKAVMTARGITLETIPCPWNLYEHAVVQPDGSLIDEPAAAGAGDYVELRAEMDLVLVCSACPSPVGDISLGTPRGAAIEVMSSGSAWMPDATTGFQVRCSVGMAEDKGFGVYARETIRKGGIVWRHVSGVYTVYDEAMFLAKMATLSPEEEVYDLRASIYFVDWFVLWLAGAALGRGFG